MKDLYTFDYNSSSALETYHEVREVYAKLFGELKIPYLVAEAASGDMGGNLSHEFHFPTAKGEDHVISCNSCDYVANEELAESGLPRTSESEKIKNLEDEEVHFDVWTGISRDRHTLINVWYPSTIASADTPKHPEVNFHAVKTVIPDFDPSIEDPALLWSLSVEKSLTDTAPGTTDLKLVNLIDCRIPQQVHEVIKKAGKIASRSKHGIPGPRSFHRASA
jgi:prolyl-tRNA synthetase